MDTNDGLLLKVVSYLNRDGLIMTFAKLLEDRERTSVLANERTYAAWARTGITSMVAGLGVEKFFVVEKNFYVSRTVVVVLLVYSILTFVLGIWRYIHIDARLKSSRVSGAPSLLLLIMSALLCGVSILVLCSLWLK